MTIVHTTAIIVEQRLDWGGFLIFPVIEATIVEKIMQVSEKADLERLFELSKSNNELLTVQLTVVSGFEWQAIDECKDKISPNLWVIKDRGKIYFNVHLSDFSKVKKLRSIDNIFIVADINYSKYDENNEEGNLQILKESTNNCSQLTKYLNIWKNVTRFPGKIFPTIEEYETAVEIYKREKQENKVKENDKKDCKKRRGCDPACGKEDSVISFRVTCERIGTHTFESGQAAYIIGGELQDLYHWIVDLTSYKLEILCRINDGEMILSLRVTPESLHRRNIAYFGPTTLRATIAYNLLSLAEPKPGDIVIDPMCGGGSIPIEGALAFKKSYIIGGDNHEKAVKRSRLNFEALRESYKLDLIQWSVTHLPLKDSYVDAFVTDMPFGKRVGSIADNRVLYKKYLLELARVVRVKSGRLVLLTYDRRSLTGALHVTSNLFKVKKILGVSMGGLNAAAYVLKRTNLTYDQFKSSLTKFIKSTPTVNAK